MISRRFFIGAAGLFAPILTGAKSTALSTIMKPLVVSTWDFGVPANRAAWVILSAGGRSLDAVEAGVQVPEADLKNHTVGRAGYPDRDGHVTLDASIMDEFGNCGAVAAMEYIAHPISVARRVMEKTPHVLLVGEGATQFAVEQGFTREQLLTPESREAWQKWLQSGKGYEPVPNRENDSFSGKPVPPTADHRATPGRTDNLGTPGRADNLGISDRADNVGTPGSADNLDALDRADNLGISGSADHLGTPGGAGNHDTIGMLALDQHGNLAGACTTSGMAWKMRGRVGDSPIIGAGLYVDNDVGGATATGVGEEVIRNAGSFLVVELMRQGRSPEEACREAVERILHRKKDRAADFQVGFLAISKSGQIGAWAVRKGFSYAVCNVSNQAALYDSKSSI